MRASLIYFGAAFALSFGSIAKAGTFRSFQASDCFELGVTTNRDPNINSHGHIDNNTSSDMLLECPVLEDPYLDVTSNDGSLTATIHAYTNNKTLSIPGTTQTILGWACRSYYDAHGGGGVCGSSYGLGTEGAAEVSLVFNISGILDRLAAWRGPDAGSAIVDDAFYVAVDLSSQNGSNDSRVWSYEVTTDAAAP